MARGKHSGKRPEIRHIQGLTLVPCFLSSGPAHQHSACEPMEAVPRQITAEHLFQLNLVSSAERNWDYALCLQGDLKDQSPDDNVTLSIQMRGFRCEAGRASCNVDFAIPRALVFHHGVSADTWGTNTFQIAFCLFHLKLLIMKDSYIPLGFWVWLE